MHKNLLYKTLSVGPMGALIPKVTEVKSSKVISYLERLYFYSLRIIWKVILATRSSKLNLVSIN